MNPIRRTPIFPVFYQNLLTEAGEKFLTGREDHSDEQVWLWEGMKETLEERYRLYTLRVLIQEMHRKKAEGAIAAGSREEEYRRYEKEYTEQPGYSQELKAAYPALAKVLDEITKNLWEARREAWERYKEDREELEARLGRGEGSRILKVENTASDLHRKARSVFLFLRKDGKRFLYKPRSLAKEAFFQETLAWLAEGTGLEQKKPWILDRGDYGWMEWVEAAECVSETEPGKFYERMGQVLFLAYLFSMSDLHQENVIAAGAFPVVIDGETLPGASAGRECDGPEEAARQALLSSVLSIGILPFCLGGKKGNGAVLSAIGDHMEQKSWVRVPVIAEAGTSDMHIQYAYVDLKPANNLPRRNGDEISAGNYAEDIVRGFSVSYRFALENRSLLKQRCRILEDAVSRVMVRNTQQYTMYLSGSFHPDFLSEKNGREEIFGRHFAEASKGHVTAEIAERELCALLRGDIPIFYGSGRDGWLYGEDGERVVSYFPEGSYEFFCRKLKGLCAEDEERQIRWIRMSLALLGERSGGKFEPETAWEERKRAGGRPETEEELCERAVRGIYERLKQEMIFWRNPNGKWETGGLGLQAGGHENGGWEVRPMSPYLYDGIAGIALFAEAYEGSRMWDAGGEEGRLGEALRQTLFSYTDRVAAEISGAEEALALQRRAGVPKAWSQNTGAFFGEGSLVYAYLLLYRIGGRPEFLEYAKKQARVLETLLEQDEAYDLLEGNAGAIVVLCELYALTGEASYRAMAERAAEVLRKACKETEDGAGWVIPGQSDVLAGLSHGESGFALAYYRLYEATGKEEYRETLRRILARENVLYSPEYGNWPDLRGGGPGEDMVAWCHGAAGVLASRLPMRSLGWEEVERDTERALKKTKVFSQRERWCLCHGNLGNLWILQEVLGKEYGKEILLTGAERIAEGKLEARERYSLGFMTGIAGMGYQILTQRLELPNVLFVGARN